MLSVVHRAAILAGAASVLAIAWPVRGGSASWSNPAGGEFLSPSNWSTGQPPSSWQSAVFDASFPASFAGRTIDATAKLVRYTLAADANLDLQVDTLDFNALAADFGTTGQRWSHGDFNYDGVIDTLDFNALARNFGQTLPAAIARNAAGATGSASGRDGTIIPVPEPAGLAGALLCAVGVLPRRRRR